MPTRAPGHIRPALPSDAATIADFNARMAIETENTTLPPEVVGPGVRAALDDPGKAIYFVAEIDGRVAGQLMITHEWSDWRNGDIWWVQSVYVHPDFRRRGLFRALYEHARRAAKEAGAVGVRLYVEENNVNAQAVYRQLGMSLTHYKVMEEMWGR
jgi:ribosomal protein S18 acetylase RimI-like enzyme